MNACRDRSRAPLVGGLLGSLLCFAAQPPCGLAALAWLGPIWWLRLVPERHWPVRRPYWRLWLAGTAYWLLTIHWLRLPHPSNYVAWPLLAAYLGTYLPLAIALMRAGVLRLQVPLWLAAPVVWTALEGVRSRLFSGFSMGALAHSQAHCPRVIQLAELGGEYAVTFAMLLFAGLATEGLRGLGQACVSDAAPDAGARTGGRRRNALLLAWAGAVVAGALVYGDARLSQLADGVPGPLAVLVQGNALADWKGSDDKDRRMMEEQWALSLSGVRQAREVRPAGADVVVWAETMFRTPLIMLADDSPQARSAMGEGALQAARADLAELARISGSALIVGIDRFVARYRSEGEPAAAGWDYQGYNSSAAVDRAGAIVAHYDKMHLLPLGEYIPLVDWFPLLRKLTPITGLAAPGAAPAAFRLDAITYAPNICYESAVPHLIRRQIVALQAAGQRPDVLVNLTNDAWYHGSSELDMHLACGMFRCVETRTPMIVAANRGLSAHVDAAGRLQAVSPRDCGAVLLADVRLVAPADRAAETPYVRWGDWLPLSCGAACLAGLGALWQASRNCVRVAG